MVWVLGALGRAWLGDEASVRSMERKRRRKKAGTESLMVNDVAKVLCLAAVFPAGAVVGWVCALVDGHSVKDVHEELMKRRWTGKCSKEPGQMRVVNLQSY